MVQLILKNEIEKSKIDALLYFLKSWNIDAELKIISAVHSKKRTEFTLATGLWKNYNISAEELRNQAWIRHS